MISVIGCWLLKKEGTQQTNNTLNDPESNCVGVISDLDYFF